MNTKQHRRHQRDAELETNQALEVLERPGQALDSGVRQMLEPRFGHSFADVRVHSDSAAARSAEDLEARAFTVGQDIVMNSGEYDPNSPHGLGLLAHELAHTIQQPTRPERLRLSQPSDSSEREAGTAARNAVSGAAPARVSSHTETAGINRMISGAVDDWELPSWGEATGAIGGAISGGAGALGSGISGAYGMAGNAVGGIGGMVGDTIGGLGGFAGDAARGLGSLFGEGSVGAGVGDIAGSAIGQISGLIGGGVSGMAGNAGGSIAGFGERIGAGIGNIGSSVGEFVGGMGMPQIDPEWLLM
jgi:Domain of unknown function (DUF4157)